MNENKQLAIRALEQMKGDDLYRARWAFRGLTDEQMKEQYGQSGKTRAEILKEYEVHDARVNQAIAWVMSAPETTPMPPSFYAREERR